MLYLTGIEALTGLVLITWTASFLYLEMQRYWRRPGRAPYSTLVEVWRDRIAAGPPGPDNSSGVE